MADKPTNLNRRYPASGALAPNALPSVLVHGAKRHGVWHVTRDAAFVGDYFMPEDALRAAIRLAAEIELSGRCADVTFDTSGSSHVQRA